MAPELKSRYYFEHLRKTNRSIGNRVSPLGIHHAHLNRFIRDNVLTLPEGSAVLDGGCGLSIWVTESIRMKYKLLSMDCQIESLAFCHHHYHDNRYLCGDLYKLPFADGTFDAVVLREVIEHVRKPEIAVSEIRRVLKAGGLFVLTTPNYSSFLLFLVENLYNRFFSEMKPYLDDVHPSKFRYHQLKELLNRFFEIKEYKTIDLGLNLTAVVRK